MILLSSLLHSVPTHATIGRPTYSAETYVLVAAALLFILLLTGVQTARDTAQKEQKKEWEDE